MRPFDPSKVQIERKNKKGEKPVRECRWCRMKLASKYQEKNHVCRTA